MVLLFWELGRNSIHHKAMRFFLGTSKYTPNIGVHHWSRCLNYDNYRLYCILDYIFARCKNWPYIVKDKLYSLRLNIYTHLPFSRKKLLEQRTDVLLDCLPPLGLGAVWHQ